MAKRLSAFSLDDTEVMKVLGFMDTMGKDLGKSRHLYPVMQYVFEKMDTHFTAHMSKTAPSQAKRFHHVYEWNMIGVPNAKLWDTTLIGSGASRQISFNWRASKTQVPLPDPLPAPSKTGKQLNKRHVFVWKAPMMEYQMSVTINPVLGDNLAFMASDVKKVPHRNSLWFSKGPVTLKAPPGSEGTGGAFTKEFLSWWTGGGADDAFDKGIRQAVEEHVGEAKVISAIRKARGNVGSATVTAATRRIAKDKGRSAAKQFLKDRDVFYAHQAENRRDFVEKWGGGRGR